LTSHDSIAYASHFLFGKSYFQTKTHKFPHHTTPCRIFLCAISHLKCAEFDHFIFSLILEKMSEPEPSRPAPQAASRTPARDRMEREEGRNPEMGPPSFKVEWKDGRLEVEVEGNVPVLLTRKEPEPQPANFLNAGDVNDAVQDIPPDPLTWQNIRTEAAAAASPSHESGLQRMRQRSALEAAEEAANLLAINENLIHREVAEMRMEIGSDSEGEAMECD
jgi:hypothetical protein